MPSAPKILYRFRQKRPPEILQKINAAHFRRAPGNIGITRKVTVNLESINQRGKKNLHAAKSPELPKDRIHRNSQSVRNHQLLEQSPEQKEGSRADAVQIPDILLIQMPNLLQQIARLLNGPLH